MYERIRDQEPDVRLFEKTIHLTRNEFDCLLWLATPELQKPMDVRQTVPDSIQSLRVPRKRILDCGEMLFIFLDTLGGVNEGGAGRERTALKYGMSIGTASNYFRHALISLLKLCMRSNRA